MSIDKETGKANIDAFFDKMLADPTISELQASGHLPSSPALRRDIEEFACVWFEQTQKWIVLLPDGSVIDRGFGAIGYAVGAVHELTGRGEAEFECVETGDFFRYVRDDEFWAADPAVAEAGA